MLRGNSTGATAAAWEDSGGGEKNAAAASGDRGTGDMELLLHVLPGCVCVFVDVSAMVSNVATNEKAVFHPVRRSR